MADHTAHTPATPPHGAPGRRKVLYVTPVAPWKLFGGTATVSKNLIELFSETLDVQVCCLRSDEPGEYPREEPGAMLLSGRVPAHVRRAKFFFDFRPASFAHRQFERSTVRERFAALLARHRPEFIIFDHIFSAWLVDLAPDPATCVVYIAHDDMVAYADSLLRLEPGLLKRLRFASLRRQYRRLQNRVLRRADYVLTMTAEDTARLQAASRAKIEVAPLHFSFPNSSHESSPAFRYLLITGSFDTWEKKLGLLEFLREIFTPLLQQRPDFRLVIAGRIPRDVQRKIGFQEPQVRVVHAPSEEKMGEIIRHASAATVLDVQSSGLKIKTIELASAGLPLVSWPPGLEGTLLTHGASCLQATSAAEFVSSLDRLYVEPALRRQLGTAARRIMQAEFSKPAALARLRASELFTVLAGAGAARAAS